jgi:hypothetical protein
MRWLGAALLAGVLLGSYAARAQSAGDVLAGPYTVQLPSAELFSFAFPFYVPPSIAGSYVLRVQLSAPNSLTTLSLKLNGAQVLGLSDFAGGTTSVDRLLTLAGFTNTVSLRVAGKKGTRITITILTAAVQPRPTALLPNPLALNMGTTGDIRATLSPTPTAPGTLSVTSSSTAVADVPPSVAFGAGQAEVLIPVTALAPGSATVTAAANGGQASTTVAVNAPPAVSIAAPANGAVFTAPASITVRAEATDSDGAIAKVEFFDGATLIGSVVTPPFEVTLANAAVGTHALTARATDNQGATATSAPVNVLVNAVPVIFGQTPKDVTLPGGSTPEVGAAFLVPGGAPIDPASVRIVFDGADVTSQATVTESGVLYPVTQPLPVATHTVSVSVASLGGSVATDTWSFAIDDPAPNFHGETPKDVFVAERDPLIRVLLSGFNIVPSSIQIVVDGVDVTAQADVGPAHIAYTPASPLADGLHSVSVAATDGRGVVAGKQWSFTVELPPPPATNEDGVRTGRSMVPELRVLP